jgi:hypothetical protein
MSYQGPLGGGGGGGVDSVTAGTNITVSGTASEPVINNNGVRSLTAGTNVSLGGTVNDPVVNASGGGVTGFTGSQHTAIPNNTVNASQILVDTATANGDFVAQPKGSSGSFMLALPNSSTSGGNKRGASSVDLQLQRGNSGHVAGGSYSFVAGDSNSASNTTAIAIGHSNVASGSRNVAIGQSNAAQNTGTFAIGRSNVCNALYAGAFGQTILNTGSNAYVFGGPAATNSGPDAIVIGSNINNLRGSCLALGLLSSDNKDKAGEYRMWFTVLTTNATPTYGQGGGSSIFIGLSNTTAHVEIIVVARNTSNNGEAKCWKIEGVCSRNAAVDTFAFIGTPSVTVLAASSGTDDWAVEFQAETTTFGTHRVQVTGESGKNIRWLWSIKHTEIQS